MIECIITALSTIFTDSIMLYAFQALLIAILIFAEMAKAGYFKRSTGANATVRRSVTSWNYLNCCFGIISINVLQIINSADNSVKYKVLMSSFDLAVMIRLFFFNGWFRNKAIGIVGKAKGLQED